MLFKIIIAEDDGDMFVNADDIIDDDGELVEEIDDDWNVDDLMGDDSDSDGFVDEFAEGYFLKCIFEKFDLLFYQACYFFIE